MSKHRTINCNNSSSRHYGPNSNSRYTLSKRKGRRGRKTGSNYFQENVINTSTSVGVAETGQEDDEVSLTNQF